MAHIQPMNLSDATERTAQTLKQVKANLGMLPNLIATMAHSQNTLESYLYISEQLSKGSLNSRQREMIALAVSQFNLCQYCLSAHHMLASIDGMNEQEIVAARRGEAIDPIDQVIVSLAYQIAMHRGMPEPGIVEQLRAKGISNALMIEIIANVVLTIMTNYINNFSGTEIDFPVKPLSLKI